MVETSPSEDQTLKNQICKYDLKINDLGRGSTKARRSFAQELGVPFEDRGSTKEAPGDQWGWSQANRALRLMIEGFGCTGSRANTLRRGRSGHALGWSSPRCRAPSRTGCHHRTGFGAPN